MATAEASVRPDPARVAGAREAAVRRAAKPADGVATSAEMESRKFSGEDRFQMIAEAAYFRAEMRGFEAGSELDDWLAAEVEVDDLLSEAGPIAST
jgi:hypothetical protein